MVVKNDDGMSRKPKSDRGDPEESLTSQTLEDHATRRRSPVTLVKTFYKYKESYPFDASYAW